MFFCKISLIPGIKVLLIGIYFNLSQVLLSTSHSKWSKSFLQRTKVGEITLCLEYFCFLGDWILSEIPRRI